MIDIPPTRCSTCGRPLAGEASGCPACTAMAQTAAPAERESAQLIADRYLPQRMLGRGGAKEVWLAHDLTLDRPVAIARALAGAAGAEARERMRREARLMARLGDHPHVVTVYDAVEDRGALHIVARFMAGGSLAARLAAAPAKRLGVAEVLRTGRALADALAHAHEHGVVHRDVKPDNVWLAADGSAGLGDFGIAVAAGDPERAGSATGTPYYQAPEQAAGGAPLPESDLYALGATLWELLCGRPPFLGPDAAALLAQHRHAAPEPPSRYAHGIDAALDALVLSLLSKPPRDRPADAAGVRDALDRLGGAPSVPVVAVAADRDALVGRDAELASLRRALGTARGGSAHVVAIAGEAGIGKTRLVDEAAAEAGAGGAAVVRGRAGEESRAYGPWRGALRPLVTAASGLPAAVLDDVRRLTGDGRPPEVAAGAADPAPDAEEERLRLFDAVVELIRAAVRERELFVALEDLHDADRSSLLLLAHLMGAAPEVRLLVVLTYRSAGLGGGHALAAALEAFEGERRLTRVALRGLSEAAVGRFMPPDVDVAPGTVRALHERTAGNPFFLRELVRLLAERGALGGDGAEVPALVPERVREVVGRRLEPLEPATREVLAIAGVVGRPFTIAGVARIGGLGRENVAQALQPALAGRLVEARPDSPGRFGFAHAIVRDAVYGELPPALRARLHASVAAVLQESLEAGGEATAADAAHHALAAARCGADAQAAWALSLEAAREAAALQAHAEEAGHYAGALEALELGAEATPAERLETTLALAAAAFAAGDIEAARRRFRTVAAAARRSGAAEVHARAAVGFSEVQRYGSIDADAIALLQDALDVLPPDDSALRARASARLGLRLDPVTDQARREALLDDGVAMARRLDDADALVSLLSAAALVDWPPERAAARRAAVEEVLGLAARGADLAAVFWARTIKLRDALEAGDLEAVDAELDRLARMAAESRRTYYRWCVLVLQAARAIFGGRLDEGERLAEDAVALNRRHGDDADQEHTVQRLALALLRRRPQHAPIAALRDYAARYPALPVWEAMLAQAEWGLRADGARRSVTACARDGFTALLRTPDWLCGLALLAEPVAAAGTGEQIEQLAAALAPHAGRNAVMDDAWAAFGPVARPLGLLAAAAGRREEAAGHFAAGRRARGALGRARLGAGCDRRLDALRCGRAGLAARPRDRARARPRAALDRVRAGDSDHDAVGLHGRLREVRLGRDRVAAVAPVVAPAAAHEEAARPVAGQRGRVLERSRAGVERLQQRRPVLETAVDRRARSAPGRAGAASGASARTTRRDPPRDRAGSSG